MDTTTTIDDPALRPQALADFIGQPRARALISMALSGARARHEQLDHVLLYGPPGLGKTTLARIIATEANSELRTLAAPSIQRPGDLASVLVGLREGDYLFLDEIHRLNAPCCELLYGAMEDYRMDLLTGEAGAAQAVSIPLPRFTLIGATTRPGALPRPLRDRFGLDVQLEPYGQADLAIVATRSAALLGIPLTADIVAAVAVRSRGTPRLANRLLRRLRDFAAHRGADHVDADLAAAAFEFLEIDSDGLDGRDRRYLACLRERGRAVGVGTLAVAMGEDTETLEDEIEPWLIASGFVDRTPNGRVLGPRKV